MAQKWRQNDHFFGKFLSLGEVFGILQILVLSMRAPINKWGVFGIFTLKKKARRWWSGCQRHLVPPMGDTKAER